MDNIIDIEHRTPAVRNAILAQLECVQYKLSNIKKLDLRDKKITNLYVGDFDGLTGLEELNLEDNHLKSLPEGVFRNLDSLKKLNLQVNHLRDIDINIFKNLINLDSVLFGGNKRVTFIEQDVLDLIKKEVK